ncbi:hypothetical protein HPB48_004349 [Haemaphysalis longicornis]|uniref:Uncharacterized protein n=1 Tax=Haemaphysalis longicornis TaxID=44386 RepID=A0A9J6G014_HAELO|nr:hypothetical protein HPB48_004349 [Haemaphysalis longicornis]
MFLLTHKFNSDPIESLFGTLRMSAGSNDVLGVRAALPGLHKMLKAEIAASNALSNVTHAQETAAVMSQLPPSESPTPPT